MVAFFQGSGYRMGVFLLLACLWAGVVICPVSGADTSDTYVGELGDTINLHGYSFVGDQVYLFFTGPNLPENGVSLTDPTQRADQGHFTVTGVDHEQQWSYKWNTDRISNEIVAGTYTVYVSNEPVDRSGLAGNNYKTLTVYLKDSSSSSTHSSAQASYTLNPEMHSSTPVAPPTTTAITTIPTPEPTVTILPNLTLRETPTPTKKTPLPVIVGIIAVSGLGIIHACSRQKREER
jgi:hypothetical protein